MLLTETVPVGSLGTNCYILRNAGSNTCLLIDPGEDAARLLQKLQAMDLTLEGILLTHGHFDHVMAVSKLANETGCPVWLHKADHHPKISAMASFLYPLSTEKLADVRYVDEGDVLHLADLQIQVLATPGHTEGSVCYLCENALFAGDTLFAGSIGRTDLPGGSYATIQSSLARLAAMEENHLVFPGHGESSDLSTEKRSNPYLRNL